jgi:TRAP-type C4-dicarboxylate transport system substrate-binding protein
MNVGEPVDGLRTQGPAAISRRKLLKASVLIGAGTLAGPLIAGPAAAQSSGTDRPIRIRMGGYGPPNTSFSQGLKMIGDRIEAEFGDAVAIHYVYNVLDLGYEANDLKWLVDSGILTIGYLTMTDVPELELASLPFLFPDTGAARAVMDGPLGQSAASRLEASNDYRILGFFENGFRHVSNNVRPVRKLADLKDLRIRVLGAQRRTFELLGADPRAISLTAALEGIQSGELDGQENPFANTVTYGFHRHQRFHTATFHSYLSRPIFVHRPSFDSWSEAMQATVREAARDAVAVQRDLHDREEEEAQRIIRDTGGEIVELAARDRAEFVAAVAPIYADARNRYPRELLELVGL